MKFEIYSARFFDEKDVYKNYRDQLEKVGKLSYVCDYESGNQKNRT